MKISPLTLLLFFILLTYACQKEPFEEPFEEPAEESLESKIKDYEQVSLTNMEVGQLSLFSLPISGERYTFVMEVVEATSDGFIIHEYIGFQNDRPFEGVTEHELPKHFRENEIAVYELKISDTNFEIIDLEYRSMIFKNSLVPNYQEVDSLDINYEGCYSSVTIDGEYIFNDVVGIKKAGKTENQTINDKYYTDCYIYYQEGTYFGRGTYEFMITDQNGFILRALHSFFGLEGDFKHCMSLVPVD